VPGGRIFRWLRYRVCRRLFAYCGENVNVERGAYLGQARTISIGSNSGIGINASVGRGTVIGSDVMMAREVLILTQNHRTSRTDIPMKEQGYDAIGPVHIGDNAGLEPAPLFFPGSVSAPEVLWARVWWFPRVCRQVPS
jgi:maltose O-acetyltransferase